MPMHLITVRDRIKAIPVEWRRQYYKPISMSWGTLINRDAGQVYTKLCGLDTDTCLKQDIDTIIGNTSWTRIVCDNCGKDVGAVIQLGQELDYESSTANICVDCLGQALTLIVTS